MIQRLVQGAAKSAAAEVRQRVDALHADEGPAYTHGLQVDSRRSCTSRGQADTMLTRYHNFLSRRLSFDPATCIVTTLSVVAHETLLFQTLACDKSEESSVPRATACKWEALGTVLGEELSLCTWSHECSWCGDRDKDG